MSEKDKKRLPVSRQSLSVAFASLPSLARFAFKTSRFYKLTPRVFCWIAYSSWLVISNLVYCYADVLEYFEELLAKVAECNGTVVWIVLFDKYVAVEAAHFWNCENTDTTE